MADLFDELKLNSFDCLDAAAGRGRCPQCTRSRKYFCYDCFTVTVPDADQVPRVQLPFELVVIHHPKESKSKSTAVHAPVLSEDVQFHTFPEFPDLRNEEGTYLLFPTEDSLSIEDITGPVNRIVVLDTTWQKCGNMVQDPRISNLPRIKIRTYKTTFWRYQNKPSDHLATIEGLRIFQLDFGDTYTLHIAIYYFYKEYHIKEHGEYNGEYDSE